METTQETPPVARRERPQVDEFALSIFESLGFESPLPDELVSTYKTFKKVKDRLQSGRLSPEGFAAVVSLYRLKG